MASPPLILCLLLLLHQCRSETLKETDTHTDIQSDVDSDLESDLLHDQDLVQQSRNKEKIILFTVATEETDGYRRYMRSAQKFGWKVHVLGMGDKWNSKDMRFSPGLKTLCMAFDVLQGNLQGLGLPPGGGQKIRLLKEALEEYKDRDNLLILFTDAYDVVINTTPMRLMNTFEEHFSGAQIVFSAEAYCWPDEWLSSDYPLVENGKRYLNSGMFLGFAKDVYKMVSLKEVVDSEDDQLYYTKAFLDPDTRSDLKMQLDSVSRLFQNLNGVIEDVGVTFRSADHAELYNAAYDTYPLIVHGNGPSKIHLLRLADYIGDAWNEEKGCVLCRENRFPLDDVKSRNFPTVALAIFIVEPTPFLEEFFGSLEKLEYPKHKMHLYLYNAQNVHQKLVGKFLQNSEGDFVSSKIILPGESMDERTARKKAIEFAKEKQCNYLFTIDSLAHITNQDAIKLLIEQNRPIIAPMMRLEDKMWSTFWGAIDRNGFYSRSFDYVQIVEKQRVGVWNVPHVAIAYMINEAKYDQVLPAFDAYSNVDADMSMCAYARDNGHFLYVDNQHHYGHLIASNPEPFEQNRLHPDLWMIFDNKKEWEKRYLHPDYYKQLENDHELAQPCPDVYDFAWFTERYCEELIEEMEHFGQWSTGSTHDERIEGGYENVPTRDIHMKQINYNRHWLYMLDSYVRPIQEKVYIGYYHSPVEADLMFIVRYRPDEQASLRPHHDASTYSIDLALNLRGRDFQGGGVRFTRYNCSVLDHDVGWSLVFPGRLTHQHEGLKVTGGTRYIGVSFINPEG